MKIKKRKCEACRWYNKRKLDFYPCCDCVGLHADAEYNFWCPPEQLNMFGFTELAKCRSCGRKVHISYGPGSYKRVECRCGNKLQAKVTVEEMIQRWNNKPPTKSILWRVKK